MTGVHWVSVKGVSRPHSAVERTTLFTRDEDRHNNIFHDCMWTAPSQKEIFTILQVRWTGHLLCSSAVLMSCLERLLCTGMESEMEWASLFIECFWKRRSSLAFGLISCFPKQMCEIYMCNQIFLMAVLHLLFIFKLKCVISALLEAPNKIAWIMTAEDSNSNPGLPLFRKTGDPAPKLMILVESILAQSGCWNKQVHLK